MTSRQDSARGKFPISKEAMHNCSRALNRSALPREEDLDALRVLAENSPSSVKLKRALPWWTTRCGSRSLWARM